MHPAPPPSHRPAALPLPGRRQALLRVLCGATGASALSLAALPALAEDRPAALAAPRGPVVLSVTGRVTRRNTAQGADFDLDMLHALPQHSLSTHTPWDQGAKRFSGPLLRDVLAAAGAEGRQLHAEALNRYVVDIPVEDTERYTVLLATRLDGQPMRVRDRGPLFVIYPFDEAPELRGQRHYDRSIWQLRVLDVR